MVAMTNLSVNLKKLRIKKGVSQKELATAIGVSHPRISEIENGDGNPTLKTIEALAGYFGVRISRLLEESKENLPKSA